ncbi:MAG: iron-containing alcohol dehydrogenase [Oscillospiraceae bacterium]|nr:iron-containing alcohol dehydrogenase [Oscillospiraceae bacterium]
MMRKNLGSFSVPEKIYFKKGCLPVALEELKYVYHKQKVLIITNPELQKQGKLKPVTDKLNELGIVYAIHDVHAGMTNAVKIFEPDCLLAFYEFDCHMELAGEISMAMEKNIYFVAVPCYLGTYSQAQPLDCDTNHNFADMVIIDTDLAPTSRKIIHLVVYQALCLAVCACDSDDATDYSDSMAIQAIHLIFEYLPEVLENPNHAYALEKLASAGTMAGIAFFNAHANFENYDNSAHYAKYFNMDIPFSSSEESFEQPNNHARCAELLNMDLEIFTQKLEAIYQLYLKFN